MFSACSEHPGAKLAVSLLRSPLVRTKFLPRDMAFYANKTTLAICAILTVLLAINGYAFTIPEVHLHHVEAILAIPAHTAYFLMMAKAIVAHIAALRAPPPLIDNNGALLP